MKKFPELSREEYKRMLDEGHIFRGAGLYEPDQAPKGTKFWFVRLGKDHVVLKCQLS